MRQVGERTKREPLDLLLGRLDQLLKHRTEIHGAIDGTPFDCPDCGILERQLENALPVRETTAPDEGCETCGHSDSWHQMRMGPCSKLGCTCLEFVQHRSSRHRTDSPTAVSSAPEAL